MHFYSKYLDPLDHLDQAAKNNNNPKSSVDDFCQGSDFCLDLINNSLLFPFRSGKGAPANESMAVR